MKNVTIVLEEDVARWARVRAAERGTSVSRLVGEMLRAAMKSEESYRTAMQNFLERRPSALKRAGRYPSRESVHDR